MKWPQRPLGELAELRGRIGWRGLTAKEYKKEGPLFLSVHSLNYGDYVDFRDAFHISQERYDESPEIILRVGDVLICKDGAGIGKLGIVGELLAPTTINSSLLLIRSGKLILPKFLYHCLCSPYFQDIVQSRLQGATTPHLYQRDITEFPVVLPPLPEQQRIVGILDEAFAGIATAKANAEKNFRNARALFASFQEDELSGDKEGWMTAAIEECFKTRSGDFLPAKSMVADGQFDVYGGNGVAGKHDEANLSGENIIIGRVGAKCGNVRHVSGNLWLTDNAFFVSEFKRQFDHGFLRRILERADLRGQARQAAQPVISFTTIKDVELAFPPAVEEQRDIAAKLDAFEEEIQRLESLYQQKLAALDALKKSLLHQAFSGQLRTKRTTLVPV